MLSKYRFYRLSRKRFTQAKSLYREHLYRKHYSKFQCLRCKASVASRTELEDHAESPTSCQPRKRHLKDGFTVPVYNKLHNKKKAFPGQTQDDKWKEIYELLFPEEGNIRKPGKHSSLECFDT